MSRYQYTEEFLGLEYSMVAEYDAYPGFPETLDSPEEPACIELSTIYIDRDGTGDFVELASSAGYDEDLIEEIAESRN